MTVRLVPASLEHRPWIRAELQSYLEELSRFAVIEKNAEGQYDYPYLDHYWREPDRHPFVIYQNNKAAGFLLVREDLDPTNGKSLMEIAELYVLPAFRQLSIASSAVRQVLECFPGNWRAAVLIDNDVAYAFWRQLISNVDPQFSLVTPEPWKDEQFVFTFSAGR